MHALIDNSSIHDNNVTNCGDMHTSDNNNTDSTTQMYQKYGPYFVGVFCTIFFIIGIIGNGILLIIIIKEKEMRQAQNIYLFSIALGDFLFILVYTPFTIFIYGLKDWPFDEATCKFITFLQTFSVGLSVFTLIVLTFDKYIEVSKPLTTGQTSLTSFKKTALVAAGAWFAAIGFATMDLLAVTLVPMNECNDLYFCDSNWSKEYSQFRTILDFTVFCFVPVIIMLGLYIAMAYVLLSFTQINDSHHNNYPHLKPHENIQENDKEENETSRAKRNKHAYERCNSKESRKSETSKKGHKRGRYSIRVRQGKNEDFISHRRSIIISISLTILFLLCMLPGQVYAFFYQFYDANFNYYWYTFKIIGALAIYVNSCINPIVLCIVSDQYRRYYAKYLCCKYGKQKASELPQNVQTEDTIIPMSSHAEC